MSLIRLLLRSASCVHSCLSLYLYPFPSYYMSTKYKVDVSGTCLNAKHSIVEVDMSVHGSEWTTKTTYAVHTNDILHSIYRSNIEDLRLRKCSIKLTKDSDHLRALDDIISPQMEPLLLLHDTSELTPELDDHHLWARLMIAFETVIVDCENTWRRL